MSDGWVRWSQWTAGGMVDFGQMPKRDISQQLRRFEKEAAKLLQKTGADHVLYGVKSYGCLLYTFSEMARLADWLTSKGHTAEDAIECIKYIAGAQTPESKEKGQVPPATN